MTQKQTEAIKTISIYDGWTCFEQEGCLTIYSKEGWSIEESLMPYHTDANEILRVWRKVRDEVGAWRIESALWDIADDNLPAACELIADIINELKQK